MNSIWAYTVPVHEDLVSGMGFTSSSSAYVRLSSSIFGWRGRRGRGRERERERGTKTREGEIEKMGREKMTWKRV